MLCYDCRPTALLQDLSHSHREPSAGNSVVGWSLAVLLGIKIIGGKKTWHCCPNIYHLHLLEGSDASHTQVVKQIQWQLRVTVIPLYPMVVLLAVAALPKTFTDTDDCVSAVFRGGHPQNFSPILIPWAVSSCSMWMIMAFPLHSAGLTLSNIFAPSSALHMSFFVNSPWPDCLPSFLCCCVSWLVFFTYESNFSTGSSLMKEILWWEAIIISAPLWIATLTQQAPKLFISISLLQNGSLPSFAVQDPKVVYSKFPSPAKIVVQVSPHPSACSSFRLCFETKKYAQDAIEFCLLTQDVSTSPKFWLLPAQSLSVVSASTPRPRCLILDVGQHFSLELKALLPSSLSRHSSAPSACQTRTHKSWRPISLGGTSASSPCMEIPTVTSLGITTPHQPLELLGLSAFSGPNSSASFSDVRFVLNVFLPPWLESSVNAKLSNGGTSLDCLLVCRASSSPPVSIGGDRGPLALLPDGICDPPAPLLEDPLTVCVAVTGGACGSKHGRLKCFHSPQSAFVTALHTWFDSSRHENPLCCAWQCLIQARESGVPSNFSFLQKKKTLVQMMKIGKKLFPLIFELLLSMSMLPIVPRHFRCSRSGCCSRPGTVATWTHNWARMSPSCPNVLTLTWRSAEVSEWDGAQRCVRAAAADSLLAFIFVSSMEDAARASWQRSAWFKLFHRRNTEINKCECQIGGTA